MESVRFITEDETTSKDMSADFGCIFTGREIGAPTVKTNFIQVPFKSGSINSYSLISSEPIYDNRTVKMNFLCPNKTNQNTVISQIYEFIHGKVLWVEFSDEAGAWYKSVVSEIKSVNQKNYAFSFSIECICMPYKYDRNSTLADWEWDGLNLENGVINDVGKLEIPTRTSAFFTLMCLKKKAYPIITTDCRIYVEVDGNREIMSAGEHKLFEMNFVEGENQIEIFNYDFDNAATIEIKYRGESL